MTCGPEHPLPPAIAYAAIILGSVGQKQIALSQLDADSGWGGRDYHPPTGQKRSLHEREKRDPWTPMSRAAQEGDLGHRCRTHAGGCAGPGTRFADGALTGRTVDGGVHPAAERSPRCLPSALACSLWTWDARPCPVRTCGPDGRLLLGCHLRSSLPSAAGPVTPQTPAPEALSPSQASEPVEPLPVFIPRGGPGSLAWAGRATISWPPWKWLGSRS